MAVFKKEDKTAKAVDAKKELEKTKAKENEQKKEFIKETKKKKSPQETMADISIKLLEERIKRKLTVKEFKDLLELKDEDFLEMQDYKFNPDILQLANIAEKLGFEANVSFGLPFGFF